MIARLPGVTAVQDTGTVGDVYAYKSPLIPSIETNALSVEAATLNLPAVAGTSLAQGRFLNAATAREPVAVLGAVTAQLLGIDRIRPGMRIWVGGQWFYVTGILNRDTYAPRSTRRSWSASPPRRNTCASTATPRRSTSAPPRTTGRHHVDNLLVPGQPGKPQPGQRLPALGGAHCPGRHRGRARHPIPRPGRGRAAGRRDGVANIMVSRSGTPLRDRAAPRPGRHPRPDPRPVPRGGHHAVPSRRRHRRHPRRGRHRRLRPQPRRAIVIPPEA